MNIRVDLNYPIKDGAEVVFRSPVDCSQITGLIVYYDGGNASQEFAFADAHGNNVGDIDHLFAENVAVKVILDVTTGMAFVQNADTNAYLEGRFAETIAICCPSFSDSGAVVTCEPVAGYPLEVVSKIEVVQEGSGDPSFENIRPIVGHTAVNLSQCGKNLLSEVWRDWNNWTEQRYELNLPVGNYVVSATKEADNPAYLYLQKSVDGGNTWNLAGSPSGYIMADTTVRSVSFTVSSGEKWALWSGEYQFKNILTIQVEIGKTETAYGPYKGDIFTAELGQAVYGGSYNWQTGELTVTWKLVSFDGTENWIRYNATSGKTTGYYIFLPDKAIGWNTSICNQFQNTKDKTAFDPPKMAEGLYTDHPSLQNVYFDWGLYYSVDKEKEAIALFKAWLKQRHDNGNPVQLCYELAEPITIQATPNEVLALQGVNTLYSDSGDTTVTGRADPTAVIEKLTNAIIALGGNV